MQRKLLINKLTKKTLRQQLLKKPYFTCSQKKDFQINNNLQNFQKSTKEILTNYKYIIAIGLGGFILKYYWDFYYSKNLTLEQFEQDIKDKKIDQLYYGQNLYNQQCSSIELFYQIDNQQQYLKSKDLKKIYELINQYEKKTNKQAQQKITKEKKLQRTFSFAVLFFSGAYIYFKKMSKVKNINDIVNFSTLRQAEQFTTKEMMFQQIDQDKGFQKIKDTGITFKDVAGMEESKLEISEFVDFLKNPQKYNKIGAKIPRGALLSGPPGTGKTLLAKACAGEAKVPFYSISGSEFVEVFVGVGAQRVRELFKTAKKDDVAIIFIDEIDSVGRKRSSTKGNSEHDSTLNQLLVEMDGFNTEQNIVVFGATNKKEILDPALLRSGRFDRQIEVALPTLEDREQIFHVHLKPLKLKDQKFRNYIAKRLASLTPGFTGAEIYNVCNEAAIQAARRNHEFVLSEDFETAVERVIAGLEKQKQNNEQEKEIVAVHESGHAVVSWFLKGAMPLLKVTIIPRSKGALGFAQYLPNENQLQTQQEILDQITSILGGRIAEQEFFGRVTTGAYDDLQKAYKMAQTYVKDYGMDDELGLVSYQEDSYGRRQYSEGTQQKLDKQVKQIIDQCTKKCQEMVKEKKDLIEKLSQQLLKKQSLDLKQIIDILGNRPFEPKKSFKAFLNA